MKQVERMPAGFVLCRDTDQWRTVVTTVPRLSVLYKTRYL